MSHGGRRWDLKTSAGLWQDLWQFVAEMWLSLAVTLSDRPWLPKSGLIYLVCKAHASESPLRHRGMEKLRLKINAIPAGKQYPGQAPCLCPLWIQCKGRPVGAASRFPRLTGNHAFCKTRLPSSSAICTAFSAAPFRRLSETHHRFSPFSIVESCRIRLTKVA